MYYDISPLNGHQVAKHVPMKVTPMSIANSVSNFNILCSELKIEEYATHYD